jgi:hypothetical protein
MYLWPEAPATFRPIPLEEALQYLGLESKWAATMDRNDPHFALLVGLRLRDALRNGDVKARANPYHAMRGGMKQPPLYALRPVEGPEWENVHLDAWRALNMPTHMNAVSTGNHEGFYNIVLDEAELRALFPRAGPLKRRRMLKAQEAALRRQFESLPKEPSDQIPDPNPEYHETERPWYEERTRFTIREAGCLAAKVGPTEFDKSDLAHSKASELRYYVSKGRIPVAGEHPGVLAARRSPLSSGLSIPEVTLDTYVTKRDLEHFLDKPLSVWLDVQDEAHWRKQNGG